MTEKFQVLSTDICCCDIGKVNGIVKSYSILHNFVRKREGIQYTIQHFENPDLRYTTNLTNGFTLGERTANEQSVIYSLKNYLPRYFITLQI